MSEDPFGQAYTGPDDPRVLWKRGLLTDRELIATVGMAEAMLLFREFEEATK